MTERTITANKSARHSIGAQVTQAKLAYVMPSQFIYIAKPTCDITGSPSPRAQPNRLKFRTCTQRNFRLVYFNYFSLVSRNSGLWHPRVMSQIFSCLHCKDVPSSKTGPLQKVHCRWRDLSEKTTVAVVVLAQVAQAKLAYVIRSQDNLHTLRNLHVI